MEVREASTNYLVAADQCVPVGYKQTEAGVVPKDWLENTVGELIDFEGGSQPDKSVFSPTLKPGYVRLIQIRDYKTDKFETYVPRNLSRRFCTEDDIMIGRYGPPIFQVLRGLSGAYNVALIKAKPHDEINRDYAYYFLTQEKLFAFIEKLSQRSSGQTGIDLKELRSYTLPLPSTKAEQEAIVEALGDADALIESLEQLLAKKRHLKQGAMQELLTGKKRLPGFSGEWEVKTMGELGDCFAGGTPSTFRPEYWGGEIWWLPSGRVQNCILEHPSENETRITKHGLDESAVKLIKPRSVLVAITGATCANVACLEFEASANQSVVAIEPNSTVNYRFVYYSLLMKRNTILSLQSGSAQGGVNLKTIKSIPLRLPPHPEQTAIAIIFSDMDAELAALEEKLAKARAIKQGMMQELLTGRIRLVQPASNVMPFPEKAQPTPANAAPHNKQINEAVIIGVLSKHFGTEKHPLPRKRRVKLTYLLHRYTEGKAEGYLKKAAGPYDPGTKYKGPETIALKNGYVREHHNGSYPGFVAGDKIVQAENYFEKWYGTGALGWLEQFKYKKTDELELLTTVDMAMVDLAREGRTIDLLSVKAVIAGHPEWVPKLSREIFSDANIEHAISVCEGLFG